MVDIILLRQVALRIELPVQYEMLLEYILYKNISKICFLMISSKKRLKTELV